MVSCHLTAMNQGLTIREVSAEDTDSAATTTTSSITERNYRKSVAKIQETSYRVPEHLQFISRGFIYEDADDVIHVIDPPKHFEELKKIMQRQEQRQLHNLRPIALREQRPKPKIVMTNIPLKEEFKHNLRKPIVELDMETQESQHLPLEILASVRKTENFLRKYKPKLPSVKQRVQTKKIQTVIWEKSQDQQQFQQSHDQRVQGIREQVPNRRYFNKKRFKREASLPDLKGEKLLNHINELIENASYYLQQTEHYYDYPDTDLESTTLQGEILLKTTQKPLDPSDFNEDTVVKILENSVKATNVIMQQIKSHTNLTEISEKCDYLQITYPNHIQNLQNQIKCMQNFIKDINRVQQEHLEQATTQKTSKQYGERLEARRTKDLKRRPFLIAQLAEDYTDYTVPSPVNSSLIYDDVMTTIRNMLESQNLQSIEETNGKTSRPWEDSLTDSSFTFDKSSEPVDFHNLQQYLTSLESIVTNLPKFSHKSLNLQEIEGGSTSKYYFINPQGGIYSLPQPFQKEPTTPAPTTIFHQFPDLPIVTEYLRNGTLLPPSQKVVEIL
ncbi:uncharacterized protein LOC135954169 [Calliphora vicina]|uniref:uncharacterized protein LOC135954169 n=1 Tax=Calliphora vicina TaxID=7373 RepID=UPI00325BD4A0